LTFGLTVWSGDCVLQLCRACDAQEEELEQQHEKRITANKLVRETSRANAAAIDKKKWLIQAEKEEDARIARYIKDKVTNIL
jgi:hypothetical protein